MWVAAVQSGGVAKLQNGRLRSSRVTESQRWGVEKLGSCRVRELQSFRFAEIQSYRFGNWHSCKAAELEGCRGTEFRAIEWLSCRGA